MLVFIDQQRVPSVATWPYIPASALTIHRQWSPSGELPRHLPDHPPIDAGQGCTGTDRRVSARRYTLGGKYRDGAI
jgi:hypothetical protein